LSAPHCPSTVLLLTMVHREAQIDAAMHTVFVTAVHSLPGAMPMNSGVGQRLQLLHEPSRWPTASWYVAAGHTVHPVSVDKNVPAGHTKVVEVVVVIVTVVIVEVVTLVSVDVVVVGVVVGEVVGVVTVQSWNPPLP
jgi:hypothetical protein